MRFGGEGDSGGLRTLSADVRTLAYLFRSYAVDLRCSKLFEPLCSLADTDTTPAVGLMLQTPSRGRLFLSN